MSIDLPGFADPVLGAQSCFRAVLDAMARPGSRHAAGAGLTPPAPLDPATAAVLLTLVDVETPLWFDPGCAAAQDWIAFHCGAATVPDIGAAAFVLALELPDLAHLNAGSDDGPEESATLILQVRGFGAGTALHLAGPGLRAPATLAVDGLPAGFAAAWADNHALFPRGVDLILCAGTTIAALPRSVRIAEG
ncbi:phosphonate C-P lyase system protein PhnH [Limobrevibacterium gyesilva]|uniref:Phosphonate C-P lyase system protein PhnH n=1 Tax=Limobrevibacterium gyesilva TaxID=2991712 RepID=A0AA41YNS1_9PROT|nr:phosphonate C-P lyase system protein PhnH [Limobrevibacterium gyesilva]MCW3475762.1 phosphonate C-P lyase system protein PhnH [Limobrevibacterium gyesilva]